jgi:16S rRNA (guanine966-N2)-methyltransferase
MARPLPGQVRIIAGSLRGSKLPVVDRPGLRPTSDRARETLFNWLQPDLPGARVLDLFAGSGALGFEALSRGAAFCLFVETDEAARGAIRDNVEAMGLFGATRIHRRDATDLGARPASAGPPFDLCFLDPPYARGLGERALVGLKDGGWLAPGAVVVFERGVEEPDPETPSYERLDSRDYGAARVHFLRFS